MQNRAIVLPWGVATVLFLESAAPAAVVVYDLQSLQIDFAMGAPITTGLHDTEDLYVVGSESWRALLDPLQIEEVPGTGSPNAADFIAILTAAFPVSSGWSYQSATSPLSDGSIRIRTYDVLGLPFRLGAEIHVTYRPGTNDPKTDIHWIQVVWDNHNVTNNPGHGNDEQVVDTPSLNGAPYYDDGYAATFGPALAGNQSCAIFEGNLECDFYDFPFRVDGASSHGWKAVLFLVQGPLATAIPGPITFLGPGIVWGWTNAPVPPSPPVPAATWPWRLILASAVVVSACLLQNAVRRSRNLS